TALLTVILLPFRVVLILVCLVVAWALANIGLYGLSKEDLRTKPLVGWRRQLRHLTALVMRTLFLFGSFNYIRYKGVRASPKEAPVICVAPHTAFYDSVCVVLFGPSAVVAKRLKGPLGEFATLAYTCAGLGITIRGRQASRAEAPVLVVSPHSSFLDAVIIYVTGLSSPLVRNADRNLGSKCPHRSCIDFLCFIFCCYCCYCFFLAYLYLFSIFRTCLCKKICFFFLIYIIAPFNNPTSPRHQCPTFEPSADPAHSLYLPDM
uniref:Phospholipid/glycerol acyltransferase domain-containing protein n=1 Tax=Anopheles melas TaxID=34690 RepID=A0A182TV66_9DIPT